MKSKPPASPLPSEDDAWLAHFLRLDRAKVLFMATFEPPDFFHHTTNDILSSAGFLIRTIQKHPLHHLWEVRGKVGSYDLPRDLRLAGRQLRRLLKKGGMLIEPDGVLLQRSKNYVRLAFLCQLGSPGVLRCQPALAGAGAMAEPACEFKPLAW